MAALPESRITHKIKNAGRWINDHRSGAFAGLTFAVSVSRTISRTESFFFGAGKASEVGLFAGTGMTPAVYEDQIRRRLLRQQLGAQYSPDLLRQLELEIGSRDRGILETNFFVAPTVFLLDVGPGHYHTSALYWG